MALYAVGATIRYVSHFSWPTHLTLVLFSTITSYSKSCQSIKLVSIHYHMMLRLVECTLVTAVVPLECGLWIVLWIVTVNVQSCSI